MGNIIKANEKMNQWCGTQGINYYEGDTALGFLFKYPVPKLSYWAMSQEVNTRTGASVQTLDYKKSGVVFGETPAIALFRALDKVSEDKPKQIDAPYTVQDSPEVLFHKVVHKPEQEIADLIKVEGLIPQVASEYKDLVPDEIKGKPVIWLASKLRSYTDAPVFLIRTDTLDSERLYPVVDGSLTWWVYAGLISADKLIALMPDVAPPEVSEATIQLRCREAVKEERERTIAFIDWLDNGVRSSASWRHEMREFRKALVGEGK